MNSQSFVTPEELFNCNENEDTGFNIMKPGETYQGVHDFVVLFGPGRGSSKTLLNLIEILNKIRAEWETRREEENNQINGTHYYLRLMDGIEEPPLMGQLDNFRIIESLPMDEIEELCSNRLPTKTDLWKAKRDKINQRRQRFSRRK